MGMIFDVLILLSGIYLIYTAWEMKSSGKVQEALVSKNVNLRTARDPKGFIDYMFVKTVIIGVAAALCGGFSLYNDYFAKGYDVLQIAAMAIYFVVLLIYGFFITKAQKKFLL